MNSYEQVMAEEEVRACFRQVQGEVPGSPVFAMKVIQNIQHLAYKVEISRQTDNRIHAHLCRGL